MKLNLNTGAIAKGESAEINPLVAGAAASVLILSLVGVGAVTGVLPNALMRTQPDTPSTRDGAGYRPIAGGCAICGTVDSIRAVRVTDEATDSDPVCGGLTGAAAGDQPGRGNGNSVMTILGAAGGASAGNGIGKNAKSQYAYRVTIRMDDGSYRTVSLASVPAFSIGDKVRVVEGRLVRA
jgi:outer membrane lipoprotein SlyB